MIIFDEDGSCVLQTGFLGFEILSTITTSEVVGVSFSVPVQKGQVVYTCLVVLVMGTMKVDVRVDDDVV